MLNLNIINIDPSASTSEKKTKYKHSTKVNRTSHEKPRKLSSSSGRTLSIKIIDFILLQ